jgi:NADH-quinone oxidoreductase subunit J
MDGFGVTVAFWILGGLAVVSALGIVLSRNLFYAVLWLILSFIGLAGLFVTLSADFVAVAQVLVYAGAVGVLVIFAIMLTPNSATSNSETRFFGPGLIVASVVSGIMVYVGSHTDWNTIKRGDFPATAEEIGASLTNRYVLPFEVASVLLMAAMIGAIVLVRAERGVPPDEQIEQRALVEAE